MENRLGKAMRNKEDTNPTLPSGSVMRKIHRKQANKRTKIFYHMGTLQGEIQPSIRATL